MNNNSLHNQIDMLLFQREYSKTQLLLMQHPELLRDDYYQLIMYKVAKLAELNVNEHALIQPDQFSQILLDFKDKLKYDQSTIHLIDIEAQKYQLFDFVEMDDSSQLEQVVFEFELNYDGFEKYMNYSKSINNEQIVRKVSYVETIYKLIQSPKQKNSYKFNILKELLSWNKYFIQTVQQVQQKQEYYSVLRKPLKELFRLSTLQIITLLEVSPNIRSYLKELLQLLQNDVTQLLMNESLRIALLYHIARMILPLIDQKCEQFNESVVLITTVIGVIVPTESKLQPSDLKNHLEVFEYLMFLILQEIEHKKTQMFSRKLQDKHKRESIDLPFIDQLWYYVSVNFTQQTIKLNQAIKSLLAHKIYSLFHIYCIRYEKHTLAYKILEDLLITPFEDDILRMKMCLNLYSIEDFSKLHQLIQVLLASDQLREHPFRPIIISLSAYFSGTHLGKAEEALCFARLNYQEYQYAGILTKDTLLAQLGYCYYKLGCTQKYLSEKINFYNKALEYFGKSLAVNQHNYLVQYNMAKLNAVMGNIDQALIHIKVACKLNQGEINCQMLCALLNSAKHNNNNALTIVNSLLHEHPNRALLQLTKAAILTEILLTNLYSDEEYQQASSISETLRQIVWNKHAKSKEMQTILGCLKKALLGIAKQVTECEHNELFTSELVHLGTMQNFDVDALTYINYRNCIFHTLDLLVHLQQFDIAQQVLELVDDGNSTNQIERLFYQGLMMEKQGDYANSCIIYEDVLKQDFYHVRTMSKLGVLYLKHYKDSKIQRASELLFTASKFDKSHKNLIGLAILNQIQGNLDESNEFMLQALQILKNSPALKFELVPDRIFV